MSEHIITVPEVAKFLRIPEARAYELVRLGILPCIRLGRQVRVARSALDAFIARGGHALPGGWRREPPDRSAA